MDKHKTTLRDYRRKFETAPPFDFFLMNDENRLKAFDMMAEAVKTGKKLTVDDARPLQVKEPPGVKVV